MMSFRRIKWKTVAILAAVLAVGMVGLCLFIGKMRERKVFVSKVVSGYRYRCTLSTDWKRAPEISNVSSGVVEEYAFFASQSPIRAWLALHLFHQSPAKSNPVVQQLIMGTLMGKTAPGINLQSGYPDLDLGPGARVFPAKHFRIDRCAATITGMEMGQGSTGHYKVLLVCTPDYKNIYFVTSIVGPEYSDQADREAQAVIDSFHVEKVAASAGGKR